MEWTSVDEQLPECDFGYFLVVRVYHDNGEPHVTTSFYTKDREYARSKMKYYSRKTQGKNSVHFEAAEPGFLITHWMQFPEPPAK